MQEQQNLESINMLSTDEPSFSQKKRRLTNNLIKSGIFSSQESAEPVAYKLLNNMTSYALENPAHPVWSVESTIKSLIKSTGRGEEAVKDSIRDNPFLILQNNKASALPEDREDITIHRHSSPIANDTPVQTADFFKAKVKTSGKRGRKPIQLPSNKNFIAFVHEFYKAHNRCPKATDTTEGTILSGYKLGTILPRFSKEEQLTPRKALKLTPNFADVAEKNTVGKLSPNQPSSTQQKATRDTVKTRQAELV